MSMSHIGYFLHIMAFSKSHMRKLCSICCICKNSHIIACMPHISAYAIAFFSIFLVKRCLKTDKYFWRQTITGTYNWTLNKLKSKMSKLCRIVLIMITIMILRYLKLHMPEICGKMWHIQHICRI